MVPEFMKQLTPQHACGRAYKGCATMPSRICLIDFESGVVVGASLAEELANKTLLMSQGRVGIEV